MMPGLALPRRGLWLPGARPIGRQLSDLVANSFSFRWPGAARQSGNNCNCGCKSASSPPTNCIEACCGGGGASNCLSANSLTVTMSGWAAGFSEPSPTCHCASLDGTYVLAYLSSCTWQSSFTLCCGTMVLSAGLSYFTATDKMRFSVNAQFIGSDLWTWQSADIPRSSVSSCTSGWPSLSFNSSVCTNSACCNCDPHTPTVAVP